MLTYDLAMRPIWAFFFLPGHILQSSISFKNISLSITFKNISLSISLNNIFFQVFLFKIFDAREGADENKMGKERCRNERTITCARFAH